MPEQDLTPRLHENPTTKRERNKKWRNSEKGQAYQKAYQAIYRKKVPARKWSEYQKKWLKKHPEARSKIQARQKLKDAVRAGRIIKPKNCSACGKEASLDGHHHLGYDSTHALDVIWLCESCHYSAHAKI